MSLVYITRHDENIYNIETKLSETKRASSMLRTEEKLRKKIASKNFQGKSRIRNIIDVEYKKHHIQEQKSGELILSSAKKYKHHTMGCAKTPIDPPCAYLRKNQGIRWRREKEHVCAPSAQIVPVPRAADAKKIEKKDKNDFVARNIENVKKSVAKGSKPRYVDTVIGTRHNLINSGLTPQFICHKDYGKVPKYLSEHKQMLNEARARCAVAKTEYQNMERTGKDGQVKAVGALSFPEGVSISDLPPNTMIGFREMPDEERKEILEKLKKRYVDLNKSYLSMSFNIDNTTKRIRQANLEASLHAAEQNMLLFEKTPVIYVTEI